MRPIAMLLALLCLTPLLRAGTSFSVVIGPEVESDGPISGRLVVYLLSADSALHRTNSALNAPFFRDPQPMFGVDVTDAKAGETIVVDNEATAFPHPLSELRTGYYRVAAVLDRTRAHSSWRREPGNLYSDEYTLFVQPEGETPALTIVLNNVVDEQPFPDDVEGLSLVEAGGLRGAVIEPIGFDPEKSYPTVYVIPGFGGDHFGSIREARRRSRLRMDDPARMLRARAFFVVLDPESANGHHGFANSANNGNVADRLTEQLIPAIERAHPAMLRQPDARIITGHSSGGWSSLWLALTEPETFGACWSSAPDPVDFRAFQNTDLYSDDSFYTKDDREVISYRLRGDGLMSVRQENQMEEVMGPRNTSAQQWDAWLSVFCTKDEDGLAAPLFDPETGEIDHAIAESMRRYDIGALVRADPDVYLPLFRDRVRLIVGSEDNYFLERAVMLLKDDLARLSKERGERDAGHRIRIIDGKDHSSVRETDAARAVPREMLEHIATIAR